MDKNINPNPNEIKKKVAKKLFAGQMKRQNSYGDPPKKKELNNRVVNTSGSYDFPDAEGRPRLMVKKIKKTKITTPKENVFQSIKDTTKSSGSKTKGGFGIFTGNATDLRNEDELKVNKKHQSRVNKILGK